MIMLVASKKDIAGMNIAAECEEIGNIHYIEEDIIHAKELPEADAYVFLSRHKSESEKPTLSAHFPGNFGEDTSHGGNAKELGFTFPSFQKLFVKELSKFDVGKYQIVLEATHHGPTHFKKPVMFVEIGSKEEQWKEKEPAKQIAKALQNAINTENVKFKTAIAFGGTHYPEKFTKMLVEGDYAIGHILPKYQSKNFNEKILDQMIENSIEKIKYCIIDAKGMNKKSEIAELAKNKGLEVVKV